MKKRVFYDRENKEYMKTKQQKTQSCDPRQPEGQRDERVNEADHFDLSAYAPSRERRLILECPVAGIHFHDIGEIWDELYVGAKLALVREPFNPHDRYAVAVALANDYLTPDTFDFDFILGYIPRQQNSIVAAILDMGYADMLEAEISALKPYGPYSDRLHIQVFLKSKETIDKRLYVANFDEEEWNDLQEELMAKGYTYQRLPILLPDVKAFPRAGERVVFVHQEEGQSSVYLMMVLAEGDEECQLYLTHGEETGFVDDSRAYVLTVIQGPIDLTLDEMEILEPDDREQCGQKVWLSNTTAEALMALLMKRTQIVIEPISR